MRGIAGTLILAAAFALASESAAHVRFGMGDFKAFYCSARVLAVHEDPYDTSPLARCEREREPWPLLELNKGTVLPAPLPGYVIAAFLPFAVLPFTIASVLWLALLVAATIAACVLLARSGVADAWTIAIGLSILAIEQSLPFGELPPIALFGLALAVWGAKLNRQWAIACGIACTFSEPQIGAAVALAAIGLGRRYARAALTAVVVLALVSIAALGVHGNLEYASVVLPAHVASELPNVVQFSLSAVLYQLGATSGVALLCGRLSWLIALALAFWFARSAAARRQPEIALLAAPAFAVVGGPFLHFDHIALAAPAALWLAMHAESGRPLRVTTLLALVFAPLFIFGHIYSMVLVPLIACWLGRDVYGNLSAGIRVAALATTAMAALAIAAVWSGAASHAVAPAYAVSSPLAQTLWSREVASHLAMSGWAVWLVKAPTWFGILATAAALASLARARQPDLALAS